MPLPHWDTDIEISMTLVPEILDSQGNAAVVETLPMAMTRLDIIRDGWAAITFKAVSLTSKVTIVVCLLSQIFFYIAWVVLQSFILLLLTLVQVFVHQESTNPNLDFLRFWAKIEWSSSRCFHDLAECMEYLRLDLASTADRPACFYMPCSSLKHIKKLVYLCLKEQSRDAPEMSLYLDEEQRLNDYNDYKYLHCLNCFSTATFSFETVFPDFYEEVEYWRNFLSATNFLGEH